VRQAPARRAGLPTVAVCPFRAVLPPLALTRAAEPPSRAAPGPAVTVHVRAVAGTGALALEILDPDRRTRQHQRIDASAGGE
jgi:hypothetical protein